MIVAPGATSISVDIQFLDDTGAAVTGKVAADFPACRWSGGSNTADTTITLSDLAAITTAHPNDNTAGGVKEREGGWYRLDLPNNMVSAAGRKTLTFAETTNKRILAPFVDVQTVAADAKAINGVSTSSVTTVNANVGTTQPVNFSGTAGSALVQSDMIDIASAAINTSAAQIGVKVVNTASNAITSSSFATNTFTSGQFAASYWNQTMPRFNATAQAGGASTITLDSGASATDHIYEGDIILITSGTGATQARVITGYVGTTKVATVDTAWATNPDNTSVFNIIAAHAPKVDSSLQVTAASVQGNVTGSVASVTGAVGSVTGAVGSVTGAVGSVTGNVGGNVVGSVGSVASGVTLAASQHVIVDSGTVTTLTNLPAITANWLTAAGINAGALNGKGDWLLASSYTAPNNLTVAQIATGIWQDTAAGDFTVAASIGKSLFTSGNAPGAASGLALVGSNVGAASSVTGDVGGKVIGGGASTITGTGAQATLAAGQHVIADSLVGYVSPDNADIAAIKVVTDGVATMLTASGGNKTYTSDALKNAPTGGGGSGLSGPSSVTLTFHDAGGSPVPNVEFRVIGQGIMRSGTDGVAAFGLNDGTYTVTAGPVGLVMFADTTLVVSSTTTQTITGTAIVIPTPSDPLQTNAYGYTRDGAGSRVAGVSISFRLKDPEGTADFWRLDPFSATSDGTGLLTVPLKRNAYYAVKTFDGSWYDFTTGNDATFPLPEVLGLYS